MADRHQLHLVDYPDTLVLLTTLLGHRRDIAEVGFERTGHGAWVDWDALTAGPWSSTEIAMVRIARGCAAIERAGGLPTHLSAAVSEAVTAVAAAPGGGNMA